MHSINYKKISLEDNLSGIIDLMYLFPKKEQNSAFEIRDEIKNHKGNYGIWVAKDEFIRTAGFSIWHHLNKNEAYFWLTAVKHGYRGLGVGSKLLDLAIQDVSELRYKRLILETFENSCKGMVKLCKQRKFKEIGRVPYQWDNKPDQKLKYALEFHPIVLRKELLNPS